MLTPEDAEWMNAPLGPYDTVALTHQGMVTVFYDKMMGRMPTPEEAEERLHEEWNEFDEAVDLELRGEGDPAKTLKELTDLVNTCYGYAISRGWNLTKAFQLTHESNMTKAPTASGKVRKGDSYVAPNLKECL